MTTIAMTLLGRALRYANGSHTVEDIKQGIREEYFQLFEGDHSVIVTEILQTPQHKTLHFFLAGGYLPELAAMLPPILEWGKRIGCTHASLTGRRGWLRSFVRKFGFQETAIMMGCRL